MANLSDVVQQIKKEREQMAREVERLDAAIAALNGLTSKKATGTGNRLSAAARERIAAAQRARWARVRAGQKPNLVSMPKRKTLSVAARRKIAAAQRARWAKVRAEKKSA